MRLAPPPVGDTGVESVDGLPLDLERSILLVLLNEQANPGFVVELFFGLSGQLHELPANAVADGGQLDARPARVAIEGDLPHVVALHDRVHDEPPLGIGGAHQSCANHVANAARSSVAADDVLRPQEALPRLGCDFQSDFARVLFENVEPVLEENANVREARETLQQSPFEVGLIESSERGMAV